MMPGSSRARGAESVVRHALIGDLLSELGIKAAVNIDFLRLAREDVRPPCLECCPPRCHALRQLLRYDYWLNGLDERLRAYCRAPHRQLRISGKSSPCSSM